MQEVNLRPFIRRDLDILFVALNPPYQSNKNAHYFSGKQSSFFKLLFLSGLITTNIDKSKADEIIFGENNYNYKKLQFGVTDLVQHIVETNSSKVKATREDVYSLCKNIKEYSPKFVCVIHSDVKKAFEKYSNEFIVGQLSYGNCGKILKDCSSIFFYNYFPNGNNISDEPKIKIFNELKYLL